MRNLAAKRVKDRFGRFKLAAKGGEVFYRSKTDHVLVSGAAGSSAYD